MNYPGFLNRVYDKAPKPEQAFMMVYLTFLYISFANLFCQKKVKKICKSVAGVFFKHADIRCEKKHGKHVHVMGK